MMRMSSSRLLVPACVAMLVLFAAACGGDDEAASSAPGNEIDRGFLAEMVPHHEGAVQMAEVAQKRGQHREIKQLADAIVKTQNDEIQIMNELAGKLDDAGVKKGDLGIPMHEMGMSDDVEMLEDAKPFDREFIDMMILHHQGAIRMARVELEKGESPEVKQLAQSIIDAQTKEIDEMNMWRVDWYGKLSPAGGVPSEEPAEAQTEEHH